jgi:hypothetical protein
MSGLSERQMRPMTSPTSAADNPTASNRDAPRRARRRLRLLLACAALVLLFIGACFGLGYYAGSEHALRRYWVPLASRALDAQVSARGLELGFPDSIRLRELNILRDPDGLEIRSRDLFVKIDLGELLRNRAIHITEVDVASAAIRLSRPAGTPPTGEPSEPEPRPDEPRSQPWIPLVVERARIGEVKFRAITSGALWLEVDVRAAELRDLFPQRETTLKAGLNVQVLPPASGRKFTLKGDLDATFRQGEQGRDLQWEIAFPVAIREVLEDGVDEAALAFAVAHQTRGSLGPEGELEVDFEIEAMSGTAPAGKLGARLEAGPPSTVAPDEPPRRDISVSAAWRELRPDLVNPLLGLIGSESLETGEVDGRLELRLSEGEIALLSELNGGGLSLAAGPDHGVTPPLDIYTVQDARLDRKSRTMTIERSSIRIHDEERLLVMADLTAPFHLVLDDATTPSLPALPPAAPARLSLQADAIEIGRMRPWLAVWGGPALSGTGSGRLSVQLGAELDPPTRAVALAGTLIVEDLNLRAGEEETVGPIGLSAEFSARSPDLARFELHRIDVQASAGGRTLALADARGAFDRTRKAYRAEATLSVPEVPHALEVFHLLADEPRIHLGEAALTAELKLEREEAAAEATLSATARLDNARLEGAGDPLVRSASLALGGRMPVGQSRVERIDLALDARDGLGAPAGRLTAAGTWPLRYPAAPLAAGVAGQIEITLRDLDLRPWLGLFGFQEEDPARPRWDASADLTLTVDPAGEKFTLEGEERLGSSPP